MTIDKNNFLINIGDPVLVPQPNDSDLHNHEFLGTVISIDKYVTVEDSEGDCFDIEPERLEVVEGY